MQGMEVIPAQHHLTTHSSTSLCSQACALSLLGAPAFHDITRNPNLCVGPIGGMDHGTKTRLRLPIDLTVE